MSCLAASAAFYRFQTLNSAGLRPLQPPQLSRPLALVVNSIPPTAPGLHLHLEAPFIMMHCGSRGGLRRSSSSAAAAAEGEEGSDSVLEPDAGFALRLVTRKLAVKGLPRRRGDEAGQQGQQQHQPEAVELVAKDLAAWVRATRISSLQIDASAQFPTPQPIPLFQQPGVLYTLPSGARAYNSHQHGEDGGRALVDALAPFCGGDERLQCRLLAPEHVLLERGVAGAGFETGL